MAKNNLTLIPEERIINKIYLIRGQRVMLDMDLAELYGVETKQLKRAVRRNIKNFPPDFMFELNKEELQNWRSQFGTSNREKMGLRIPPFAFTDYGVLMLSSVLNSERASQTNILIIRVFARMKEILINHKKLMVEIEYIKNKLSNHDDQIILLFDYLQQLEETKQQELDQANRKKIGFKLPENK
ncbi:MAG: ORF6N domain-containing protein [Bacteroidetes bacterium]|nr:ORF6N domain-containing protein [Bacteroidota bacterium]